MTLKAVLVYSNDDGFSLGVELIRAAVADRLPPSRVEHRVWFHEDVGNLAKDYLGHYNAFMARPSSRIRPARGSYRPVSRR
ncbi:hypothetical protein ACWCSH_23685, partial [Streptosporangium sp. NPDC001682]